MSKTLVETVEELNLTKKLLECRQQENENLRAVIGKLEEEIEKDAEERERLRSVQLPNNCWFGFEYYKRVEAQAEEYRRNRDEYKARYEDARDRFLAMGKEKNEKIEYLEKTLKHYQIELMRHQKRSGIMPSWWP